MLHLVCQGVAPSWLWSPISAGSHLIPFMPASMSLPFLYPTSIYLTSLWLLLGQDTQRAQNHGVLIPWNLSSGRESGAKATGKPSCECSDPKYWEGG